MAMRTSRFTLRRQDTRALIAMMVVGLASLFAAFRETSSACPVLEARLEAATARLLVRSCGDWLRFSGGPSVHFDLEMRLSLRAARSGDRI